MLYFSTLNVNDLFNVAVVVFVDGAVDTDELAMLVTVFYTGVCVGSELLGAGKRRPLYLGPMTIVDVDGLDDGLDVGARGRTAMRARQAWLIGKIIRQCCFAVCA